MIYNVAIKNDVEKHVTNTQSAHNTVAHDYSVYAPYSISASLELCTTIHTL